MALLQLPRSPDGRSEVRRQSSPLCTRPRETDNPEHNPSAAGNGRASPPESSQPQKASQGIQSGHLLTRTGS